MSILFIHGAGCTGEVFSEQVREFEDAHAPNLPGHLCEGEPANIAEFAAFIESYALSHQLDAPVLCGHSMGGAIALEVLLRGKISPRAAVLLGSGARLRVAAAILEGLEHDFDSTASMLAGFFFADPTAARTSWALDLLRRVGSAQTLRDFRACDAFDAADRLGEIRAPLLAVTGEADRLMPAKHAQALVDRVPGAQARRVAGAGHFVMTEQPAETNAAIRAFLSQL